MSATCRRIVVALVVSGLISTGSARLLGQRGPGARQGGAGDAVGPRGGQGGGRGNGGFFRGRGEPASGTAMIRGRVTTASGTPIRRAQVRAAAAGQPGGHVAATDEDGRFELRDLPAGQWSLLASKPGFVTQRLGQRRPLESVPPLELGDGQRLDGANFALIRGGVIYGRVMDDVGEPVAMARVQVQRSQIVEGQRRLVGVGVNDETDDTGAFRLYGLAAGDYFVSATLRFNQLDSSGDAEGFAATYYPGTANAAEAERVTVGAGDEVSIGFSLLPVRLVRVSGTVIGSSGDAVGGMVMLTNANGSDVVTGSRGGGIQADGAFTIANVAPGSYVLQARSGAGGPRRNADVEIGSLPVVVGDTDVTGVTITLTRGASIAGTVVADGTAPITMTGLRVSARALRSAGFGASARAVGVSAAGAFQLSSLAGPTVLRVDGLPSQWVVKSILVGSADVTDTALDLKGTEQITGARIVLTDRISEVNGAVTDSGQPGKDASVLIFADDPALWAFPTRYVRTARADSQGQFAIRGLPPGPTYLAVALSYLDQNEWQEPEFLERLRDAASRVTLREGETRTIGLRLQER